MKPNDLREFVAWRNATSIGLFEGGGGFVAGARLAGLDESAHIGVELEPVYAATTRAAGVLTVTGDVRELDPLAFPSVRLLTAGPPCQPYAANGKGAGRKALDDVLAWGDKLVSRSIVTVPRAELDDDRIGLVLEPLRWVIDRAIAGDPIETVILEQVRSVARVWQYTADVMAGLGYHVWTGVVRAEEYGVSQTRERAALVASLTHEVTRPVPTHQAYGVKAPNLDLPRWRSMADGCGWGMTHRPAYTVTVGTARGGADPMAVGGKGARAGLHREYTEGRWTWGERTPEADGKLRADLATIAALQSFPADWRFEGKKGQAWQQVGNAVPPLLAAHLYAAAGLAPAPVVR